MPENVHMGSIVANVVSWILGMWCIVAEKGGEADTP